ncbi:MAG: ATP synthase F0 sector subunit a [Firmicutes bacterium]|nr:ATP synthase F0 sector subunit a [Bacillota bacterium]
MEFAPKVYFFIPERVPFIGGAGVTETVTTTWAIMALLVIFSMLAARNFKEVPGPVQNILEILVEGIESLTSTTMGEDKLGFAPYMGTLALYLLFANLAGLFAFRPPTADLNTTMALAVITFISIHYYGIKAKGLGAYLKGFTEPIPLLLPLNIIGELAIPISLSFRLFGNILGGVIIMYLLYNVVPIAVPVVPHIYFDLFAGILQTFIFVMLSMVFISLAME